MKYTLRLVSLAWMAQILLVNASFADRVIKLTKECSTGNAVSCSELGSHYLYLDNDYVKAISLYQKSCERGYGKGCYNLGVMYRDGIGVQQNYSAAKLLSKQACNTGFYIGCYDVGVMYERGHGVKQNYSTAKEFYEKACRGGDAPGCYNLGTLYHNGYGVKRNYAKAINLYQEACDGSFEDSCFHLNKLREYLKIKSQQDF